jgi:hypothetical protein
MISLQDGEFLRANPNVTIFFPENASGKYVSNNQTGGLLSSFSSWGPENELHINPHIATPGGEIYSTFPVPLGSYMTIEGTSMAAPYASGTVALYLSAKGKTSPLKVKNALIASADPRLWNDGVDTFTGFVAPVAQQGGGLLDAPRFLSMTTEVNPSVIELNVSSFAIGSDGRTPSISKGLTRCRLPIRPTKPLYIPSRLWTLQLPTHCRVPMDLYKPSLYQLT